MKNYFIIFATLLATALGFVSCNSAEPERAVDPINILPTFIGTEIEPTTIEFAQFGYGIFEVGLNNVLHTGFAKSRNELVLAQCDDSDIITRISTLAPVSAKLGSEISENYYNYNHLLVSSFSGEFIDASATFKDQEEQQFDSIDKLISTLRAAQVADIIEVEARYTIVHNGVKYNAALPYFALNVGATNSSWQRDYYVGVTFY